MTLASRFRSVQLEAMNLLKSVPSCRLWDSSDLNFDCACPSTTRPFSRLMSENHRSGTSMHLFVSGRVQVFHKTKSDNFSTFKVSKHHPRVSDAQHRWNSSELKTSRNPAKGVRNVWHAPMFLFFRRYVPTGGNHLSFMFHGCVQSCWNTLSANDLSLAVQEIERSYHVCFSERPAWCWHHVYVLSVFEYACTYLKDPSWWLSLCVPRKST